MFLRFNQHPGEGAKPPIPEIDRYSNVQRIVALSLSSLALHAIYPGAYISSASASENSSGPQYVLPGGADPFTKTSHQSTRPNTGNLHEPTAVRELKSATVALVFREKDNYGVFHTQVCHGTRINVENPYTKQNIPNLVEVATHCLGLKPGALASKAGSISLTTELDKKYFIANPRSVNLDPLAVVERAFTTNQYDGTNVDTALLQVRPFKAKLKAYKELRPIKYDTEKNDKLLPRRGEKVYFYGSNALNPDPFMARGVFVARTTPTPPSTTYKRIDLVRVIPKRPEVDPCYFMKSGSAAVTADGFVMHPLWGRIGRYDAQFLQDTKLFFGKNLKKAEAQMKVYNNYRTNIIKFLDKKYGFKPDPRAVYCEFGTPMENTANLAVRLTGYQPTLTLPEAEPEQRPALPEPELQPVG